MRFNADEHQDQFAPLTGQHRFRIDEVKQDFTKAGDPVLVFTLRVTEGPSKGRVHYDRFICEHANPETVKIAMGKLSSLSRAVGLPRWDNEQELVGRVGECVFGPQKNDPSYAEVKRYIVEAEHKGAPAHNPMRFAAKHPELASTLAAQGNLPPAPHPADTYDDNDVPF